MVRRFLPLGIFLLLVVFLAIGLGLNPRLVPSPLIDKPAPEFALPKLRDREGLITQEAFKGQVSLLNVWATWCVSCRQEHQVLMDLARNGEVNIFGLNYKDDRSKALRWLTQLGDPYIANAFDSDGRVGLDWGVYGTPETFVIDQRGTVRYKHVGPLTHQVLAEKILPLVRRLEEEQRG